MKADLIWAYFYQLSTHMWEDPGSPVRGWFLPQLYSEENKCDPVLWDEMMLFLAERKYNMCVIDVGDGMRYDTHPEISAPDAWNKDFLREKLTQMRLMGIEPIPKLNFSACHNAWMKEYSRCLSTGAYYRMCEDVIDEVCEVFDNPRLFHLGMDEEDVENQKIRSMTVIRSQPLWWHDIFHLFSICEKHGARPWVWADAYWSHPAEYAKNMPRSVLQSNWFYDIIRDYPEGAWGYRPIHTYMELDEMGFEQVPTCSTWQHSEMNTYQTVALGKNRLNPDLVMGYMTVPWTGNRREQEFILKNDAHQLYLARQKLYPETL